MRNVVLILVALVAGFFGIGATDQAHSLGTGNVNAFPAVVSPGGAVTVSATCTAGERVTVLLDSATASSVCGAGDKVKVMITAPATAGYFEGPVTGSTNGAIGSFAVTVPVGATSPAGATSSGGILAAGTPGSTMTTVAIGLVTVGVSLFGASRLRRRKFNAHLTH